MKRVLPLAISAIIIAFTCSSCFTTKSLPSATQYQGNDISKDDTYLDLTILQTLDKGEALATTKDYDVVRIESTKETFYDGKKVSGRFHRIDTFSYVTNSGMPKTIPVFELTSASQTQDAFSKEDTYLDLTILQTLDKGEALATTKDLDVVKLESMKEIFYDGKKVSGRFHIIGTFFYTTNSGMPKTIPVFVPYAEYKTYMELMNN